MKINKDLVDAVMMLSFIIAVLVGTTEFEDVSTKNVILGIFGTITVIMVILRAIEMRQPKEEVDPWNKD